MKKQLLREAEIRKMMKFANIGALSNGFVDRLTEQEEVLPDEEEEVGTAPADELAPEVSPEEGPEGPEGLEGDDVGAEAGDEVLDAVKGVVDNLKLALSAAGPEGQAAADAIFVEAGEGGEGGEEGLEDLGGGEGLEDLAGAEDLGAEMAPPPEAPVGAEEEEMVAELQMVDDDDDEEMLNEVARRVARRLNLLRRQKEML